MGNETKIAWVPSAMHERIGYQYGPVNCGNCLYSRNDSADVYIECTRFAKVPLTVLTHGVCRRHSSLKPRKTT